MLTNDNFQDTSPLWTPDSNELYFASDRNGDYNTYRMPVKGTGEIRRLNMRQRIKYWPCSWADGGNTLILTSAFISYDIGFYSIKGDQTWKPLINEKAEELQPHISPDG
jgi:Tol biopolymer transport system component